ncbi:MAG: SH3 domain-containing protein [Clostridia bacterium]|nr:SH3 domain-containing protein [Clostridia bacterium]
MKKMLTALCVLSLLTVSCAAALAAAPSISVGDENLTVKYSNDAAQGGYTYVLLDAMEQIALVEINAGGTWNPAWTEEGLYKVRAYYQDADGKTQCEESDFTEVRFSNKRGPLYFTDFLNDNEALPSSFTKPAEYNDPTPAPTQAPQAAAPVYTLPPTQAYDVPAAVPTAAPVPTPAPAPTVSYAGTRPCFEHLNIRIRISDNDTHAATKGRSGPGTDMPQVATLNVGEVFQVLDCRILEQGNVHWFLINKNGVNCWVASGRCERY